METLIKVRNLVVSYEDVVALNGIDLDVKEGEKVGIVGPSGAGKSTLLLAIKGLLPYKGEVSLGVDLRDVGLVFQNPDIQLFMPTVFDDIAFGPLNQGLSGEEVIKRVNQATRKVGISGFEDRSPHHLSEGEKKKVAIATVLAMEPEIFLFDEPATGLDPASRAEILEIIAGIDKTVLIATHDLQLVEFLTERIIILNRGRVVADGDTCTVLEDVDLLVKNRLWPVFDRVQ